MTAAARAAVDIAAVMRRVSDAAVPFESRWTLAAGDWRGSVAWGDNHVSFELSNRLTSATVGRHPHVGNKPKDGKCVWLGDLFALATQIVLEAVKVAEQVGEPSVGLVPIASRQTAVAERRCRAGGARTAGRPHHRRRRRGGLPGRRPARRVATLTASRGKKR